MDNGRQGWDFAEDFDGIPTSPSGFMGYGKKKEEEVVEDPRATLTRAQFQNRSPRDLTLYWSGPDGPVLQSSIKANEELLVDTYVLRFSDTTKDVAFTVPGVVTFLAAGTLGTPFSGVPVRQRRGLGNTRWTPQSKFIPTTARICKLEGR